MTVYKSDWIAIACLFAVLFGGRIAEGVSLGGGSSTSAVPEPSAELKAVVAPIAAMVTGEHAAGDREEMADYRLALAEFHDRDKAAAIKTTGELEAFNKTALRAFWLKTGMEGRYPEMWAAVDEALARYAGVQIENGKYKAVDFTPEMADKAADFYRAMAWALQQEG